MKIIARVFPTKTSMSPTDLDAYFGEPLFPEFMPKYEEVHISVTFTWDIDKAYELKKSWARYFNNVKIGGVAIDGESDKQFIPGIYLRKGITINHRGCPNKCKWCLTGDLIEFDDIVPGNIDQSNNILACSKKTWNKFISMMKKQKRIELKGGLESRRITPEIADELRSLKIKTLWLACDYPGAEKPLSKALTILQKAGFKRDNLYCYFLSYGKDMEQDEIRLRDMWNMGCKPFLQLYRPGNYSYQWELFRRRWSRPAIMHSIMKQTGIILKP